MTEGAAEQNSQDGELISKGDEKLDAREFAAVLEPLITPFTKAQEVSEKEATYRTTILAKLAEKAIYALVGVVILIIALAAYALSLGEIQLVEKIVIALLAFLGGLGAGRATNRGN